ncbi:hypothetical protein E2C01_035408 [Portunus trituberculatus]|uniref:Uncharacterized protein n=1 Tax=Portunus trituberculatus TaxID=210409 RepID=A0A5B7F5M4_PORTR|nr:hypothetical protein [Portunus trituberculatus]
MDGECRLGQKGGVTKTRITSPGQRQRVGHEGTDNSSPGQTHYLAPRREARRRNLLNGAPREGCRLDHVEETAPPGHSESCITHTQTHTRTHTRTHDATSTGPPVQDSATQLPRRSRRGAITSGAKSPDEGWTCLN